MNKFSNTLLAVTLFVLCSTVVAVPIGGSIEFSGGYTTDTGDKNTATVFTFLNPINVVSATESFAPLAGGTVTYDPLDINNLPISPLWSSGIFSFDLNNISSDILTTIGSSTFRLIEGSGTFKIGTDTATGTWSFSTQGAGSNGVFSFSASNVPGPTPLILMGLGLFGISISRKFRKAQK